nr:gata transcription factor 8 [Quercus suber]
MLSDKHSSYFSKKEKKKINTVVLPFSFSSLSFQTPPSLFFLTLSLSLCNFGGFKVKFLKSLFSYTQQIKSSSFKLLGFLHKTPRLYEDIIQLEWLSNFVEDSFSGGSLTMKKEESFINKDSSHQQFQTSSPVSVLESSSSCSGEKNVPRSPETITPGRRGRARSKRPRPATFNPRLAMQLISPTSSITETPQPFLAPKVTSDSENFAESRLLIKIPKQANAEHKKKKKIKLSVPLGPVEANQNPPSQSVRKCMHCEITKTPQWRAGPMGPKTLCNACGVRYKSGRLFPEYRPAASPTFIPSLHSNSHKKVIEMRNKTGEKVVIAGKMPTMAASPELIPNANSNLALEYMGGMGRNRSNR